MSLVSWDPLVCHQCVEGGIGLLTADQTGRHGRSVGSSGAVQPKLSEGAKKIQTDAMAFYFTVKFRSKSAAVLL